MAAWVWSECGRDPGFLIGGVPLDLGVSFRRGSGPRFVIEGDEYNAAYFDRGAKFLHYRPETLLLTSVEYDHADLYPSPEALLDAYARLIALVPESGRIVACGDSAEVRALAGAARCPVVFYGEDESNAVRLLGAPAADEHGIRFRLRDESGEERELAMPLWGVHNAVNALAVWAAGRRDGLGADELAAALARFRGVKRRQELLADHRGIVVIDDFAHHPTAVEKTLASMRMRFPGRRLLACFEPRSLTAGRGLSARRTTLAPSRSRTAPYFAPIFHRDRLAPEDRLDLEALAAELSPGRHAVRSGGRPRLAARAGARGGEVRRRHPDDVVGLLRRSAAASRRRRSRRRLTPMRSGTSWGCVVARRRLCYHPQELSRPMSYSGDPALASDVKQRILTTFRQTLDLATKGSRQEALLGCDFILRLDPHFGPARTLQQLVQAGRSGPRSRGALRRRRSRRRRRLRRPCAFAGAGRRLRGAAARAARRPARPPPLSPRSGERFARLFAERRFGDILTEAEQDRPALAADPQARQLVDQARARLEAAPYVKTFVDSARQALQTGDTEEADRLIRKARVLDADHPELLALEEAKKFYSDPERSMGGRRRGIEMDEELESPDAVPAPAVDLELPEVDFSFAGLAEDNYSLASAENAYAGACGDGSGIEAAPGRAFGAHRGAPRELARAPATAASTRLRSTPGRGSSSSTSTTRRRRAASRRRASSRRSASGRSRRSSTRASPASTAAASRPPRRPSSRSSSSRRVTSSRSSTWRRSVSARSALRWPPSLACLAPGCAVARLPA